MVKNAERAALTESELTEMTRLGITGKTITTFLVGPFRYANLNDAINRGERELLKSPGKDAAMCVFDDVSKTHGTS